MNPERAMCGVLLAMLAPAAAAAHPIGDWAGEYAYAESRGRAADGGPAIVEHRLSLTPTLEAPVCALSSHGRRVDDEIECEPGAADDGIAIRFRRYVRGGPRAGTAPPAAGDTLFTLRRERRGGKSVLVTDWGAMRPDSASTPLPGRLSGRYFVRQAVRAERDLGLFGEFQYIEQEDDCVGRLVWLRLRGAELRGELAPFEGACDTVKAAIVASSFDPKNGALSFVTEPWLGDAANPTGWRFEGRLDGTGLSGVLRQVVPATGEVLSEPERVRYRRLPRLPARLRPAPRHPARLQ